MSDFDGTRDALVTQLNTIANIGNVLDRLRYAADLSTHLTRFKATISGTDQIRAWWPELERIGPNAFISFDKIARSYLWVVHGVLSYQDSTDSETVFEELIELVMNDLDTHRDFSLANVEDYSVGPTNLRLLNHMQWGSVLTHHCELEVPVVVTKTVAFGA